MIKYVTAIALAFTITGCALLGGGDPLVVTTRDNVVEEHREEAAPVPVDQLPDELVEALPEDTELVIVEEDQVLDKTKPGVKLGVNPLEDDSTFETLLKGGLGILGGFIPGLAAWEGVITLFSRRKRQHYLEGLKKAVPYDGAVDLKSAVASLGRALGASHSSEGSAEVFEAEKEMEKSEKT